MPIGKYKHRKHQGFQKGNQLGKLNRGEKAYNWKDEDASYSAKHSWLNREFGKPTECQYCKSKNTIQWASIDHKYTRERSQWLQLCKKCHSKYDLGFIFEKGAWFKECKICKKVLELNTDNFYLRSSGKFVYICKECCREVSRRCRLLKNYGVSYEDELDATERVPKQDNLKIKN